MSQTLTISDALYSRLVASAKQHGFQNIEQLLEAWQMSEDELQRRLHAVQQIDAVRERLFVTYSEMPDSVDILREDRAR